MDKEAVMDIPGRDRDVRITTTKRATAMSGGPGVPPLCLALVIWSG